MGEDSSSSNRRMHGVGGKEPWELEREEVLVEDSNVQHRNVFRVRPAKRFKVHSGRHKRQHTPQSPTVVPFMAGELVGVAQKSKSPPSLVFLGIEKAEFPRGGGWKGRCGRGNDWLRMEEGIRERKGEERKIFAQVGGGWGRGKGSGRKCRDWLTADLRQGPQLAARSPRRC